MLRSTGRAGTSAARRGRRVRCGSSGTRTTTESASRGRSPSSSGSRAPSRRTTGGRRLSTCFTEDHWFEDLYWLEQVDRESRALQLPQLVPARAADQDNWLEQRVRIEALVDDHLAAAGTPVGLDARRIGTVFLLSGGVLRVRDPVGTGESYRVWSYAPDPTPRSLASAPRRYPAAVARFLEIDGRTFPAFGTDRRESLVRRLFDDPSYEDFTRHRPMYAVARRVAGQAETPYAAVLALESWFRQTGGFTYDETPPKAKNVPLVAFVTRTKAGYCQHFAGAMAAMLRMLGIPARVAVGFTSGTNDDGTWVVTDHDAHAWVEVWFAGLGWIPFDPTPGRGTFGGEYSFASSSDEAVAALRRGELAESRPTIPPRLPDAGDLLSTTSTQDGRAPSLVGARAATRGRVDRRRRHRKGTRASRSVPVPESSANRDCEPSRARGLPARPGSRRTAERDARDAAARRPRRARAGRSRVCDRSCASPLRAAGHGRARRCHRAQGAPRAHSLSAKGAVPVGSLPRLRVGFAVPCVRTERAA